MQPSGDQCFGKSLGLMPLGTSLRASFEIGIFFNLGEGPSDQCSSSTGVIAGFSPCRSHVNPPSETQAHSAPPSGLRGRAGTLFTMSRCPRTTPAPSTQAQLALNGELTAGLSPLFHVPHATCIEPQPDSAWNQQKKSLSLLLSKLFNFLQLSISRSVLGPFWVHFGGTGTNPN